MTICHRNKQQEKEEEEDECHHQQQGEDDRGEEEKLKLHQRLLLPRNIPPRPRLHRYGLLITASLYTFLFVGAIFGWGPMQLLLEKNGAFSWKCENDDDVDDYDDSTAAGGGDDGETCPSQASSLVNVQLYATGTQIVSPFLGQIADRYGARYLVYTMAMCSWMGLGLLTASSALRHHHNDNDDDDDRTAKAWDRTLYLSFALVALGTWCGGLLSVQTGMYFRDRITRSRVIFWINAMFDAGSVTYLGLWSMVRSKVSEGGSGGNGRNDAVIAVSGAYLGLSVIVYGFAVYFWTVARPEGKEEEEDEVVVQKDRDDEDGFSFDKNGKDEMTREEGDEVDCIKKKDVRTEEEEMMTVAQHDGMLPARRRNKDEDDIIDETNAVAAADQNIDASEDDEEALIRLSWHDHVGDEGELWAATNTSEVSMVGRRRRRRPERRTSSSSSRDGVGTQDEGMTNVGGRGVDSDVLVNEHPHEVRQCVGDKGKKTTDDGVIGKKERLKQRDSFHDDDTTTKPTEECQDHGQVTMLGGTDEEVGSREQRQGARLSFFKWFGTGRRGQNGDAVSKENAVAGWRGRRRRQQEACYVPVAQRRPIHQFFSQPFLLLLLIWTIQVMANQWTLATTREFLGTLGDDEVNNRYLDIFTVLLPASLVAVPFTDIILRTLGFHGGFQVMNLLAFGYNIVRLVGKSLNVQVLGFVFFSFYRSFLFGVTFSFLPTFLSPNVVGKFTGVLFAVTGALSFANIPLASFAIEKQGGDATADGEDDGGDGSGNGGGNFFVPNLIYTILVFPCVLAAWGIGQFIRREEREVAARLCASSAMKNKKAERGAGPSIVRRMAETRSETRDDERPANEDKDHMTG